MPHSTDTKPKKATSPCVSFFRNAKAPSPVEDLSVLTVLERIRSGEYQSNVNEVLDAPPDKQQEVKGRVLPAFTPAGRFSRRAKDGLLEHSGLGVLDIDDKSDAEGKKAQLALDPHVYAVFRSPRGGVKVLFPVLMLDPSTGELRPPESDDEHKAAMATAFGHFAAFEPDPSGVDVARLCYVSFDPAPYINVTAVPFEIEMGKAHSVSAHREGGNANPKPAGRAPFDAVIPHGSQYTTLAQIIGALRRLGLGESILSTVARAVYDHHLEYPNDWPKIEGLVRALAEKPVEAHESAQAMSRRAILALQGVGLLNALPNHEEADLAPLPWRPFPVAAMPRLVADYVNAQAEAIGVDPAFVAGPVMAVLAAGVGNSYRIGIKQYWDETSAVWIVTVADSGTGKSPAQDAAMLPVYALEREAKEQHEEDRAEYEALDKEAKKGEPEPQRRRFRVGDTTIESLVSVHAENPRGLVVSRDELAGWLGSFDRYARGESDLQAWIEMHGGRPIVIDRKSSNPPVLHLESPHVCVTGAIQPDILRGRLSEAHFASGFAARLLLVEPPTRPKRWSDADVSHHIMAEYLRLVRGLYALPMGAGTLRLTPDAEDVWISFYDENAAKQHALSSGPLKSAVSKHEALAARLALVLHLADTVVAHSERGLEEPGPISADAMRRGVHLARWFRYETARLYRKYGVEKHGVDRDVRLAAELPETFGWEVVADIWQVEKANTYKTILPQLIEKGLIEKASHGEYRRLTTATALGKPVDFADFVMPDPATEQGLSSSMVTTKDSGSQESASMNPAQADSIVEVAEQLSIEPDDYFEIELIDTPDADTGDVDYFNPFSPKYFGNSK